MKTYKIGWTTESDALDCIYPTKKEAQEHLIYAFGGECGDCGFKSHKEILDTYPVVKVQFEIPTTFNSDVLKCFKDYTIVKL